MDKGEFERKLHEIFDLANQEGKLKVVVKSGELHRLVGGYPVHNHRMTTCC
jgi:hypothetical protein